MVQNRQFITTPLSPPLFGVKLRRCVQGLWLPSGENVKLTVAVKVLRDGTTSSQNSDLLEEARIMASVHHPCCVRIAAVCMTKQLMVVTQLMQYGCVLDFIRRQRDNISSRLLLRWAAQIASVRLRLSRLHT